LIETEEGRIEEMQKKKNLGKKEREENPLGENH